MRAAAALAGPAIERGSLKQATIACLGRRRSIIWRLARAFWIVVGCPDRLRERVLKSWLGGIADAFEDRNFRRYSVGSIVSWRSYFVQAVAVSWTTWDLTHSTRWLAIVALMPLGGVVADRHDRVRVLLISYALATLQAAVLAGLAFAGELTIGLLAALSFLHGAIHAFSIPAQFGFLPRFVERRRLYAIGDFPWAGARRLGDPAFWDGGRFCDQCRGLWRLFWLRRAAAHARRL